MMFIKVEIWTVGKTANGIAALLRLPSTSRCVPVYVDPVEAQAILSSLSGVKDEPPRLSEVLNSFGRALSVRIESVEIFRGSEPGNYRSVIHFAAKDARFTLDARTPDAIAVALRSGTPVFLDDSIAEEDAIGVNMAESDDSTAAQLARLRKELGRRVNEEDYEQAALIRDRINQLEDRMRSGRQ